MSEQTVSSAARRARDGAAELLRSARDGVAGFGKKIADGNPVAGKIRDWGGAKETIRVAVLGTENCGKTVFLASLASHFENHVTPNRATGPGTAFDLKGRTAAKFKELTGLHGGKNDPIAAFPYRAAEAAFRGNPEKNVPMQWPASTGCPSELAFRFELFDQRAAKRGALRLPLPSLRRRRTVEFHFLDIPGERLADFLMEGKSYDEWSDEFLAGEAGLAVRPFAEWLSDEEKLRKDDPAAGGGAPGPGGGSVRRETLLARYAEAVKESFEKRNNRYLSPSTVRVSKGGRVFPRTERRDGKTVSVPFDGGGTDGNPPLVDRLGLPGRPFVPLPRFWRENGDPETVREFRRNYAAYRKEIVDPLTDWMHKAHFALLLVDVFSALDNGRAGWECVRAEARTALSALRGGTWLLNGLWRTQVARNGIRVVVTKTDLEAPSEDGSDVQGGRLVRHAIRMLGDDVSEILGIPIGEHTADRSADCVFMSCAAVQTHPKDGNGDDGGAEKFLVPVPDPDDAGFDLDAHRGEMQRAMSNPPRFHVTESSARHDPPRQSGLDAVARFLLGIPEED